MSRMAAVGRLRPGAALSKALHGFSWMMGERLVSLGSALLVTVPLARYLGPSDFGKLNYVVAIAMLVAPIASLGLNHTVTKELKEFPDRHGPILGTVAVLRKLGALAALLLAGAWLLLTTGPRPELTPYILLILLANMVASFQFLQYWSLANGTVGVYSRGQIINGLIFSGLRLLFIFLEMKLSAFLILSCLEVAGSGAIVFLSYRVGSRANRVRWRWDAPLARKLMSKSWMLTISGLTAVVYLKIDTIMLAYYSSAGEVGVYSAAARLSEIWYFVPTLLMTAIFPAMLDLRKRSMALYNRRLQDMFDLLAAVGSSVSLVVSLGASFIVHLLFGNQYAAAAAMLSVHVWSGVFIFMRQLYSKWMIAEDLYAFSLISHGFGAVVNVVLNIFLIPRYGGMGASVATLISYATSSYFALFFHRRSRPVFWMMTRSLLWPRRIPDAIRLLCGRQEPA